MQILEKRSSESVVFDIDCSLLLAATETITSVTSSSAAPVTTMPIAFGTPTINVTPTTYMDQFGSSRVAAAGKVIQVRISGGLIASTQTAQDYVLRFVMVTSLNTAVEATVKLRLNDTPA